MISLSPEQLLAVADEFCSALPAPGAKVRSFAALCAAAAVSGARVHGVPVFTTPVGAARALAETIARLEPLTCLNDDFAEVARRVYLDWAAGAP